MAAPLYVTLVVRTNATDTADLLTLRNDGCSNLFMSPLPGPGAQSLVSGCLPVLGLLPFREKNVEDQIGLVRLTSRNIFHRLRPARREPIRRSL